MNHLDNRMILATRRANPLAAFAKGAGAAQGLQKNALAISADRQEQSADAAQRLARSVLSSASPGQDYPRALEQAQGLGFDVSKFPQQWGDEAETLLSLVTLDTQSRTDFERAMGQISPAERRTAARTYLGLSPRAKTADPLLDQKRRKLDAEIEQLENPQPDFSDRQGLRKEFIGQTTVKDFRKQAEAFGRIDASAFEPSPAGDLALIFNYMKVLDPGSVVRESEFATAARSGSYGDRIQATVDQILAGTRLSEDQRADFVGRAQRLYADAERQYTAVRDQYAAIARDEGFEVDKALPDYRYRSRSEDIPDVPDFTGLTDEEFMRQFNQVVGQ
ncbi:MAG: hypothetical protein AAGI03_02720 [Pseudomonadota bacterium]